MSAPPTNALAVMRLVQAYADTCAKQTQGWAQPYVVDAARQEVETALLALAGDGVQRLRIGADDVLAINYQGAMPSQETRDRLSAAIAHVVGCRKVLVLERGMTLAGVLGAAD